MVVVIPEQSGPAGAAGGTSIHTTGETNSRVVRDCVGVIHDLSLAYDPLAYSVVLNPLASDTVMTCAPGKNPFCQSTATSSASVSGSMPRKKD